MLQWHHGKHIQKMYRRLCNVEVYNPKQQIEKMVDKKQKSLEKIAMRLLPVVRKDEAVRLSKISKKKAAKVGKSSIRISGLDAY